MVYSLGGFIGIFYEAVVLIILIIIFIQVYRIYRVSKMKLTLYLALAFIFVNISVFFSWIGKFYLWQLGGEYSQLALMGGFFEMLIYKFKFTLAFMVIGNYFFCSFFKTVLNPEITGWPLKKITIVRKIIEIMLIITLTIPIYLTRNEDIADIMDAIAFFIVVIDSLYFFPAFYRGYKLSKVEAFGKKYLNICLMSFFMFGILPLFFLERITLLAGGTGLTGEKGFTIFYYLGWIFVILAETFSYYGFIRK